MHKGTCWPEPALRLALAWVTGPWISPSTGSTPWQPASCTLDPESGWLPGYGGQHYPGVHTPEQEASQSQQRWDGGGRGGVALPMWPACETEDIRNSKLELDAADP